MTARGKAIQVKIATAKVIEALETRLAQLEKDYASQEAKSEKFNKKYQAWQKDLGKWAISNFSKSENLRTNYRNWNKTLNVDFDIVCDEATFPKEPEKDFEEIHSGSYRSDKEEMSNAIRMLKMTDEEVVNASTFNAIARYL